MMKQRLTAILQIKSRRFADFYMWLNWYVYFLKCDDIYICDDDSVYDITKMFSLINTCNIHYIKMRDLDISHERKDFNRQQKNINAILRICQPKINDIILLPDDDEFWWYDATKYKSFIECVNDYRIKLNNTSALYVPWTLMRSKEVMHERPYNANFADAFQFRCNVTNCEHKPVLFYKGPIDTSFHCGYIDGKSITSPSNLYYHSMCKYDEPLRCYHFRFTTVTEYAVKRLGEISIQNKPRSYLSAEFLHHKFNGQDQNDKYEIYDATVFETYNKIICQTKIQK